jgi:CO dehydrogenase maturation factor
MEHLSRRTTNAVDVLFVVSEATVIGIQTAGRIAQTTKELPIAVKRVRLVLNRVPPTGLTIEVAERIEDAGLEVAGEIPLDDAILVRAASGHSLSELPRENGMFIAVRDILTQELNVPVTTG